ncbi:hypothetical protein AM5_053 [Lactococcus phage AM5]|uniref:Uncharacterized protein n=1 Tax=Lactococcus phage AM5 TaxID=1965473 RepID=A0A1W6JKZ3_9CAUD|nr:hypothetical protein AM5_053 [Lactococcus phage AM5]
MKLKELLPVVDAFADLTIIIVNPKDTSDEIVIGAGLTYRAHKILNKYEELKIKSLQPICDYVGNAYLAIYLIGDAMLLPDWRQDV